MIYPAHPFYQPGVGAQISAQQPFAGYNQPPPSITSQQRPQTPPNPAAAAAMGGGHPGMPGAPATIQLPPGTAPTYISPASASAHLQHPAAHPQQPMTPGVPPLGHAGSQPGGHTASLPGASTQPPLSNQMNKYERRPRSHAIKILNPLTNEEVTATSSPKASSPSNSATVAASAASASSEAASSPSPSMSSTDVSRLVANLWMSCTAENCNFFIS